MNIHSITLERAFDFRLSSPHFDPSMLLASAASGFFNLISGGAANSANADAVRAANASNERIADANNKLQVQLARENRDWQQEMYKQSLFDSRQTMDYQHLLNSPGRAVEELRSAGINPSLGFGNTQPTSMGSSSVPSASGSGVSLSTPQMMAPHYEALKFPEMASSFGEIARGMSALAEAKRLGVETKQMEATFNDFLEKYHADTEFSKVAASLQKKFAEDRQYKELVLLDKNILEKTETIKNLVASRQFTDAQKVLTELKQETERQSKRLSSEQADFWNKKNDTYYKEVSAYIQNQLSQTSKNYADSSLTTEQKEQLSLMRDYNVDIRRNQYQMSQAEVMKQGAILYQEIDYLLGHFETLSERERAELEHVKAAADMAKWKYDMRWIDWSLDTIERINDGVNKWAPFALSRESADHNTSFDYGDGSRVTTSHHSTSYKAPWQK